MSTGLLLLYIFQIPNILVNLGGIINLSDWTEFFTLTVPLAFLGWVLVYLGVIKMRFSDGKQISARSLFFFYLWILASFIFYSFRFSSDTVGKLLSLIGIWVFFIAINALILSVLWRWFKKERLAGIIVMAGAIILSIARYLIIMFKPKISFLVGAAVVVGVLGFVGIVGATHSWDGYHWARTANPLTLKLGDNLSSAWTGYLVTTSYDWSLSSVLDTIIVPGRATSRTCKPTLGQAEICNAKYGRTGWRGVASVWASGDHITQGTVRVNDYYFNTAEWNTPARRNLVMCQEVGHVLGLAHQDEDRTNLPSGTCMDYSNDAEPDQHPNLHDYEMLEAIYAHLDTTNTASQSLSAADQDIDFNDPKEWGKEIKKAKDGRVSLYERNLGRGQKVFTFVFWADL